MNGDYTGAYDPSRNPNSAMLRVVAEAGMEPRVVRAYMTGTDVLGDPELVVKVEVATVGAELVDEAEHAGFDYLRTTAGGEHGLIATFGVPDQPADEGAT